MRAKSAQPRVVVAEAARQRARLEEAVAVHGPDAGRDQSLDRGVGMRGGVHAVGEVEDGGDTGLERLHAPAWLPTTDVVGVYAGERSSRIPLK